MKRTKAESPQLQLVPAAPPPPPLPSRRPPPESLPVAPSPHTSPLRQALLAVAATGRRGLCTNTLPAVPASVDILSGLQQALERDLVETRRADIFVLTEAGSRMVKGPRLVGPATLPAKSPHAKVPIA